MPTNYTLTFSKGSQGWPSFYSYHPEFIKGMNQFLYTFKGGNLFIHNSDEVSRNNFYGTSYPSTLKSVINSSPLENKLFKTLNLEGDAPWDAKLETDLQATGFIDAEYFDLKEASYYAFVRNDQDQQSPFQNPTDSSQFALRSFQGIGAAFFSNNLTNTRINYFNAIGSGPPITIPTSLSVGDFIYYGDTGASSITPVFAGVVTAVVRDIANGNNYIDVDTSSGTQPTTPPTDRYFMFVKNSIAESNGVLGHYCVFELTNNLTTPIELFTVDTEVMKSFP